MDQLSGLDGLFINMEMHGNPMHIASFSIYQAPACKAKSGKAIRYKPSNFQNIHRVFDESLLEQVPILKSRLLKVPLNLDQPYWVEDEDFDLNYHLRHIALPPPGNWATLMQLISDLHALPLSRSKPLWEAYVIDGLDNISDVPKGAFGMYIKSHHALMDGRTGLQVFTSLHSLSPRGDTIAVAKKITQKGKIQKSSPSISQARFTHPSTFQMISRAYANNIKRSWGMSKILLHALPHALNKTNNNKNPKINSSPISAQEITTSSEEQKKEHTPRTRFNAMCGAARVVDRIRVPLPQIQAIRKASPESTVNDVAMTIIGGAMRRYLLSKNECPEDSIVATIPIDIRNKTDNNIKGNMLSIMNVAIQSNIADPLQRLKVVCEASTSAKEFSTILGKNTMQNTLQNVHSALGAWALKKAITSSFLDQFEPLNNTVITNVPGVPVPMYLAGAKMFESFGIGPLMPKTGSFHTISSCSDWLSICFTACKEMVPDPNFYRQCLQDEFVALKEAACQNSIDREKPARKSKARKKHTLDNQVEKTVDEGMMHASAVNRSSIQPHQH